MQKTRKGISKKKNKSALEFALVLITAIIVASVFYFAPIDFHFVKNDYESNLAAALKVELQAIKTWQQKGGIKARLAYGSRGSEVKLLQHALKADSEVKIKPETTGYFGAQTKRAVIAFQKQQGLPATGVVSDMTREKLNEFYFNEVCPKAPDREYPDYMYAKLDRIAALPAGYTPIDLVNITDKVKTLGIACLRKDAAVALEQMFADAAAENILLGVSSSFRREEIQQIVYNFWLNYDYADNIDKVAVPLHSEHQLGTAVDLTGRSINYSGVDRDFANTVEGIWLANNSYKYGFIQSYPDGKKNVTGYDYEPWHYRYIGKDIAFEIKRTGVTLQEYLSSITRQ